MAESHNDEMISSSPGEGNGEEANNADGEAVAGEAGKVEAPREADASAETLDLLGRQLGDFRVLRRLGSGAMAEVFLAEQVSLKRQVALKVLKPELVKGSDDTHLKRFVQEASAAANLNHPHIVQIYAIGQEEDFHYIAQEYVAGPTVRQWLRRSGPPEPLRAMHVLRQVARALQAADEAGIIHRDIKPENILLTKKLSAKVADFGLARLSLAEDRVQLTQVGIALGTPLYMSPEQVAGKDLDHRSDLYSLGVTAYQMLAGNPPFQGETALSVAVQHMNSRPEPLVGARGDLPPALCELIEKMMAKRPEERYQHAAEVVEDLSRLGSAMKEDPSGAARLGLRHITVARSGPRGHWPLQLDRFFSWSTRRHAGALASAALVVLLVGMGAGWITRPANPFDTKPANPVPEQDSARQQYLSAVFSGSAEAYEAVREYFPEAERWRGLATMRLALIRLSERDFAGAQELFSEMAASGNRSVRIDGQTGLALVAAFNSNPEVFRKRLAAVNLDETHRDLQRLLLGMRDHRGVNTEVRSLLNELFPAEEAGQTESTAEGTAASEGEA